MRYLLTAVLSLFAIVAHADTYTTNMSLVKPSTGSVNWGGKVNGDFDVIDTSMTSLARSTGTLANVKASTGTCTLPLVLISLSSNSVTCAQPSNVTGQAATALALAALGTAAPVNYLCRGVDVAGNCLPATVDQSVIAASTSPVSGGSVNTALAGKLGATAAAGGSLSGNYPNPTIAAGAVGASQLASSLGISSGCAAGFYLSTMTVTNGIVTGGGCVAVGGGSGGSLISTGTLAASATSFPLRNQLMFDNTFTNVTDSPTINATFLTFKNMGGITSAPTRTVLTSGSAATYTVPNGVSMLRIRMVAGGGGGGGASTGAGNGGAGGDSSFNSISAKGGSGGCASNGSGCQPTAGGSAGSGSASVRISGGSGGGGAGNAFQVSGFGGVSAFGGSGGNNPTTTGPGGSAATNSGSGGGGAYDGSHGGAGGGAGEYVEILITSPSATYTYTVGVAGTAGAGTLAGGAGGSGVIIIDEYYGTQGFSSAGSSITVDLSGRTVTPSGTIYNVAMASVTLTLTGAAVDVCFSGSIGNGGSSLTGGWNFLVDSAFYGNLSSSKGVQEADFSGSSLYYQFGGCYPIPAGAIASGSHTFAFLPSSGAGNTTYVGGNNTNSARTEARFWVREIRNSVGTGDVASNGTNNLSGANTITAAGSLTTSGAINVLGTANFEVMIASGDVTNGTSITFSNLASSVSYHLTWDVYWVTNNKPVSFIRYNGDSGSHYTWESDYTRNGSFLENRATNNAGTYCGHGNTDINGAYDRGEVWFRTVPSQTKYVHGLESWNSADSSLEAAIGRTGCIYQGSATLSSVTYGETSATNFSGHFALYQRN